MAPTILGDAVALPNFAADLIPRAALPETAPTKTLPLTVRGILTARQAVVTVTSSPESTDESASNNNLSSGAIAGIVIGSIAGFLLLLWIIRSCGMWSRPNEWGDGEPYDDHRHRGRSPASHHRRRHHDHHHHHRYHQSTSRPRRPSYEVDEVRYSQPVVYEKRRVSASPRPPPAVYRTSGSRSRY